MAVDLFLKLSGIDGESVDRDHKNELDILSWSWGVTDRPSSGRGGGKSGKAVPGEFTFVHHYDRSSPLLAGAAASGRRIATAVLSVRHRTAGQRDFMTVTLQDVRVTSVQVNESTESGTEQVSFRYGSIDVSYRPQDLNGSLGDPVTFGWNVKKGKVT